MRARFVSAGLFGILCWAMSLLPAISRPQETPAGMVVDKPAAAVPADTPKQETPAEKPTAPPEIPKPRPALRNQQLKAPAETRTATDPQPAPAAPAPVQAASESRQQTQVQLADAIPGAGTFPFARTLGGLGLVLSCIFGGFVAVKKFAPQYLRGHGSDKSLRVIETLSMGDKRSIALVQVGDQRFLLGSTSQQINVLSTLGGGWAVPATPAEEPAETHPQKGTGQRTAVDNFRSYFESEKKRPATMGNARMVPADIRAKMRQLRDGLEG